MNLSEERLMDANQLSGKFEALMIKLVDWASVAVPNLIGALVVLVAGWCLADYCYRGVLRLLERQHRIDATLRGVIALLVRYGILILVVVAVLGQLGIQTTSVLAALGAAGLAIGLAMQGTLSNIAAGMMLLWLRPFNVGDYVDAGSVAGTVKELGLFATELQTWDGIYLFVPNSELWNKRIINYTRLPTRLVDLKVGVSYQDDLAKGQEVLLDVARDDQRTLSDPEPIVFVDELGDSAVVLRLRVWTANADYWPLLRALTERGKLALEAAGLSIPFPQRDVHLKAEAGGQGSGQPTARAA
jgi:small conductance mechanosensitive channel